MARQADADPLEKFRFKAVFHIDAITTSTAGGVVNPVEVGFMSIQIPKRTTNKIQYREGTHPDIFLLSAGLSSMEDIVLERGLKPASSNNPSTFYAWIAQSHNPESGITGVHVEQPPTNSIKYRANVDLIVLDRKGAYSRAWKIYNAFPIAFSPGSDLNSQEDGDKLLESITLAYEDFRECSIAGIVLTPHTLTFS